MANPAKTLVPERSWGRKRDYFGDFTVSKKFFHHAAENSCAPTGVGQSYNKDIFEHIVVKVVVGGESHDSTPTNGE